MKGKGNNEMIRDLIITFINRVLLSLAYCAGYIVGFVQECMRCIGEMMENENG